MGGGTSCNKYACLEFDKKCHERLSSVNIRRLCKKFEENINMNLMREFKVKGQFTKNKDK
jgi:hypothetical protein